MSGSPDPELDARVRGLVHQVALERGAPPDVAGIAAAPGGAP